MEIVALNNRDPVEPALNRLPIPLIDIYMAVWENERRTTKKLAAIDESVTTDKQAQTLSDDIGELNKELRALQAEREEPHQLIVMRTGETDPTDRRKLLPHQRYAFIGTKALETLLKNPDWADGELSRLKEEGGHHETRTRSSPTTQITLQAGAIVQHGAAPIGVQHVETGATQIQYVHSFHAASSGEPAEEKKSGS
ncbi:MAG: hypothetical protein WC654_06360 [Patescibacteria group bacterium]